MYLKFEKQEGSVSMYGEFLQGVVREVSEEAGKALLKIDGYVEATKEEFDKQEVAKEKVNKTKKKEVKP